MTRTIDADVADAIKRQQIINRDLTTANRALRAILVRYLAERPAFRSRPIGAPHSAMRQKQQDDIALEEEAKKLLGITP